MKLSELIKSGDHQKKIRRKIWDIDNYIIYNDGYLGFTDTSGNSFYLGIKNSLSDDWEEYVENKKMKEFKVGDRVRCGKHEGVVLRADDRHCQIDFHTENSPTSYVENFLLEKVHPKLKVGDKVYIPGVVTDIDNSKLPYKVQFLQGEAFNWFEEGILIKVEE